MRLHIVEIHEMRRYIVVFWIIILYTLVTGYSPTRTQFHNQKHYNIVQHTRLKS
jgi:hypothetical protein